jgi:predicted lipase
MEEKTKNLEKAISEGKAQGESLNKLKRFGVFVKTYNMSHLLATRYKVTESFGIDKHMENMESIESDVKETQNKLNKKESEENKDKDGIESLKQKIGELRNNSKEALSAFKLQTGTELFNRFMRGFVMTKDNQEENEKISNTQFLFNKLNF